MIVVRKHQFTPERRDEWTDTVREALRSRAFVRR